MVLFIDICIIYLHLLLTSPAVSQWCYLNAVSRKSANFKTANVFNLRNSANTQIKKYSALNWNFCYWSLIFLHQKFPENSYFPTMQYFRKKWKINLHPLYNLWIFSALISDELTSLYLKMKLMNICKFWTSCWENFLLQQSHVRLGYLTEVLLGLFDWLKARLSSLRLAKRTWLPYNHRHSSIFLPNTVVKVIIQSLLKASQNSDKKNPLYFDLFTTAQNGTR